MTSAVLTPWWREKKASHGDGPVSGGIAATRILDWRSAAVQTVIRDVQRSDLAGDVHVLRAAHALIAARVRPVYSLNDARPASLTLALRRGSCSQRLAVLEAVARGYEIPTRVRGLLVDGRFWYPRFKRFRALVPNEVLLAWPEFDVDGTWLEVSELFGSLQELSGGSEGGFTNAGGETLFDAVSRTAVDWDGRTSEPGTCSACDLSARVLVDLGRYDSRDELFGIQGQTLSWAARTIAEPVLGRWSA